MPKKKYSKEEALALLKDHTLREAAEISGVPFQTLWRWQRDKTKEQGEESPSGSSSAENVSHNDETKPMSHRDETDILESMVEDEERDISARRDELETRQRDEIAPTSEETVPISEVERHLKPPSAKRKDLEYTERIMGLLKENSRLKAELQRLRGSRNPHWNGDPSEERERLELERERVELELEREELKTLRQLRRQSLFQALSGKSDKSESSLSVELLKMQNSLLTTLMNLSLGRDDLKTFTSIAQLLKQYSSGASLTEQIQAYQAVGQLVKSLSEKGASATDILEAVGKLLESPSVKRFGETLSKIVKTRTGAQSPPPPPPPSAPFEMPSEEEIALKALPSEILQKKSSNPQMATFAEPYEMEGLPPEPEVRKGVSVKGSDEARLVTAAEGTENPSGTSDRSHGAPRKTEMEGGEKT